MSKPLEPGSTLGPYRLTGTIGRGGMGVVYKAENTGGGEAVALKVLAAEIARSEEFRRRFLRESRYASVVEHPNVVRVLDAGEDDGVLYMAMQLVNGTNMQTLIAEERALEPQRVVNLMTQIADAVDAVHEAGLLHRDLKPGNVIVEGAGDDERAWLTDFGLGKDPIKDSVALTAAGTFVGSSAYSAPEQILAVGTDRRVDVYSMGCMLFECLTGQPPFQSELASDVLRAHVQEPPPAASGYRPTLPTEIDAVIAKAMAKEPNDRHESAGALAVAVAEALGNPPPAQPVATPETPTSQRIQYSPPSPGLAPLPAPGAPPPAPAAPARSSALKLTITAGPASGQELELTGETLFGRSEQADERLGGDPEISRRHARIFRGDEQGWRIEDLGSTNGSLVNERRITGPVDLSSGDLIEMGTTTMTVEEVEAADSAAKPPAPETALYDPETQAPDDDQPATEPQEPVGEPTPAPASASPRLSLRLEVDFESGEVTLGIDEDSEPIRLEREGRGWRVIP